MGMCEIASPNFNAGCFVSNLSFRKLLDSVYGDGAAHLFSGSSHCETDNYNGCAYTAFYNQMIEHFGLQSCTNSSLTEIFIEHGPKKVMYQSIEDAKADFAVLKKFDIDAKLIKIIREVIQ